MPTLYLVHRSPWSERALFALLHHRIAFDEREHVPLIGELALRRRAKSSRASVPLLVADDGVVQGSVAIGEWADAHGKRSKLFPEAERERIHALHAALEDPLNAARERFFRDLAVDRDAQLESSPTPLRKLGLGPLSARIGAAFLARKYGARVGSVDDRIRAGLRTVSEAVGKKNYVLDELSFADIVASSIVGAISPVADEYAPCPPAVRKMRTHEKLLAEFPHLVEWRDALYAKHRPKAKH